MRGRQALCRPLKAVPVHVGRSGVRKMSHLACRALAIVLVAFLAGCTSPPQWSEPVFKAAAATPEWLAGLWADSSGDELMRLHVGDNGYEVLSMSKNSVSLGTAAVTARNNDFFISMWLGDAKYLVAGPGGHIHSGSVRELSAVRLSGYFLSFVDRVSDDEIRITEIDFYPLFTGLAAR
jgi:hypothetical protein